MPAFSVDQKVAVLFYVSTPGCFNGKRADARQRRQGCRAESHLLSIAGRRTTTLSGHDIVGRGAREVDGRGGVSSRKDVGIRRHRHLGVGWLQRRVRRGPGRRNQKTKEKAARAHSQPRVPALQRREGPDLFSSLQLCAISEPARSGSELTSMPSATSKTCSIRQDVQLQKFFAPFAAGSSRRSSATTCTSGRRTRRRAIRRRSSAPET